MDAVTGAFSYAGSYIAQELVARGRAVRTLSRAPAPSGHPLGGVVGVASLALDDEEALTRALAGVDVFYNTFWIRFPRKERTFEWAIAASARLFRAAAVSSVRRIVHLSVTQPSLASPYAYFRAKAAVEELLLSGPVDAAVVRPSLVFGGENEILLNNIAWLLRRLPLFALPRRTCYVQPVDIRDVAQLALAAAEGQAGEVTDAVGPETYSYRELVERIRDAVGSRARLLALPEPAVVALARAASVALRDPLVTSEELGALSANLLTSATPARGQTLFSDWVVAQRGRLGIRYHSELDRHWRGR